MFDNPNFFTSQRNQQNPPFATAVTNAQTSSSPPIPFAAPWSVGTITTSPFPQPQIPTPTQALFFAQSQYIVMPAQFKAGLYRSSGRSAFSASSATAGRRRWTTSATPRATIPWASRSIRRSLFPGVWGAGGTGCAGIVTTGPAAVKPGAAGTNCSTTKNQTSRFLLTTRIRTPERAEGNRRQQYLGGGGGSVIVGDEGTANYNGLVASIQHRLVEHLQPAGQLDLVEVPEHRGRPGRPGRHDGREPQQPRDGLRPMRLRLPAYRERRRWSPRATSTRTSTALTRLLINDWELAPLMHIQSGAPFTVTQGRTTH